MEPDQTSHKPYELYENNDWRFLTRPKIENQWFERKAHDPSRQPGDLRNFIRQRIAPTICAFANSNPDVGGLLVIGIGDRGELHGIDRFGTDYANTILSYADYLDGPTPEHRLVEFTREDGAADHLIFIYTPFLPQRVARTTDGQCHVRRGDKTVTLQRAEDTLDLAYRKGELHFEDEPAIPFDEQELEPSIVSEFIEQYIQQRRLSDSPSVERALRLARLTA